MQLQYYCSSQLFHIHAMISKETQTSVLALPNLMHSEFAAPSYLRRSEASEEVTVCPSGTIMFQALKQVTFA